MRVDNVLFCFVSAHDEAQDLRGSVVIDGNTMTLDITDPSDGDYYLIVGSKTDVKWEGRDESLPRPPTGVKACWTRLDHRYIGVWQQGDYEYLFTFELPGVRDSLTA